MKNYYNNYDNSYYKLPSFKIFAIRITFLSCKETKPPNWTQSTLIMYFVHMKHQQWTKLGLNIWVNENQTETDL